MNNKQLLQQALDVLASYDAEEFEHGAEVMQALRAAIDQPGSEPVAHFNIGVNQKMGAINYDPGKHRLVSGQPIYAAPVDYGHCNTAALRTERDQLKAKNEKLVDASEIALGELDRLIEVLAGRSTIKAANTLRDALKENT